MVSVMIAAAQVATDIVPDLGRCGDCQRRDVAAPMSGETNELGQN
jgi:hypothetical protein